MKDDVGFTGNQFTLVNSCFTAGYIVGQWPSAIILASGRISPRFWFPFCVAAWGFCTLGTGCEFCRCLMGIQCSGEMFLTPAVVTNPHQVMAIRFVQAIFEASTFSGSHVSETTTRVIVGLHAHERLT